MNKTSNIKHQTLGQPKLSIVVPIYNVERYLRKCVDSVLTQDYDDYEIILVDDGSTDGSGAICDEYASPSFVQSLTRSIVIKVIHQKNGGLSSARNSGTAVAQGEYIMFVDSDDYLEPNVLGGLIERIERDNLDVLRFNYQNVRENGEVFVPFKTGKPYFDYSEAIEDGETFLNERLGYACYAVMFVIRRDLLDGYLFTEGIYFEDTDWTPRMLLKAKRVSSTNHIVYNYLWREGSITLPDNLEKQKKVLNDKMRLIKGFLAQQKQVKDKRWFTWQVAGTTMSILEMLSCYSSKERESYISQLKEQHIFPLTRYRAVGNNKWKIRIANISPTLYCNLMHFLHK